VGFQVGDEIGNNTLVECSFKVAKGSNAGSEQGPKTPFGPVLGPTSIFGTHTINTLVQDQNLLKGEISEVKQALAEERTLNAKCHENLISVISAFTAKFTSPSSSF